MGLHEVEVKGVLLSCFSSVQLCVTLWTTACQAPLFTGFSRQEYWSGLPCPPPGDLPNPGIEPASLMSPALAGEFFTTSTTWRAHMEILNRAGGVRFPKAMKETEESRGPSSKTEESVQCPPLQNLRIFRNQNLPHCLRDFYNINYGLD